MKTVTVFGWREMRDTLSKACRVFLSVGLLAVPGVACALGEDNVLLLYNSKNADSSAIAQAYLAARPRVTGYDLSLSYPALSTSQSQTASPPPEGMNNQFITPERFEELFRDDDSDFRQFLDAHPNILAIATTRGLPAAISTKFKPNITPDGDGIVGSFEAALANINDVQNEYFSVDADFEDFINRCHAATPRNRLYLVSRLDSANANSDHNGDGDMDSVDGVLQLIERSVSLPPISLPEVAILADRHPSDIAISLPRAEITVNKLWDLGFHTYLDNTTRFLHGPFDMGLPLPIPDPCETGQPPQEAEYFDVFDAPFTASRQTLGIYTSGRNHTYLLPMLCDGEPIHWEYIRHYDTHPAATLVNLESFSGWRLHTFTGGFNRQGQSLWWISEGASFAYGNVREPGVASQPRPEQLFAVLYGSQRTWAEAFYASLPFVETWPRVLPLTPIGDPVARPVVGNPDLNGDGAVTFTDLALMSTAMLTLEPPTADLNADGLIDVTDLTIAQRALGRTQPQRPSNAPAPEWLSAWPDADAPSPLRRLGDLDGDGLVDFNDLNRLLVSYGSVCATSDVNLDGLTDFTDLLTIVVNTGSRPADVNNNGVINLTDLRVVYNKLGRNAAAYPRADVNLDGVIDRDDLEAIRTVLRRRSEATP